jgi:hypothetical protein
MLRNNIYNFTLVLLIILQCLFMFVFNLQSITSQDVNAISYFSISFLFGFVVILKFYGRPELTEYAPLKAKYKYIAFVLMAGFFLLLNSVTIGVFKTIVAGAISDIVPTVKWLAERFLAGKDPYNPANYADIGQANVPAYLPMHWLPYTIAEFFHFDYRSISFSIWCTGFAVVAYRSMKYKKLWLPVAVLVLLSLQYLLMAYQYPRIIGVTVEIMVSGYYMLLISGLNQKNFFLSGLIIGTCMLSRYYVAVWLPLWAFVLFVSGNRKQLLQTALVVISFVSVLFILPYFIKDHAAIQQTNVGYRNISFNEWHNTNGGDSLPYHLYYGLGFAYLFYQKYLHTDLLAGFILLRQVLFIATSSIVFLLGVLFWFIRSKINYRIFLIASFKIYLAIFLAFIMAPYLYLYITDVFVSIALFAEQARYNIEKKGV